MPTQEVGIVPLLYINLQGKIWNRRGQEIPICILILTPLIDPYHRHHIHDYHYKDIKSQYKPNEISLEHIHVSEIAFYLSIESWREGQAFSFSSSVLGNSLIGNEILEVDCTWPTIHTLQLNLLINQSLIESKWTGPSLRIREACISDLCPFGNYPKWYHFFDYPCWAFEIQFSNTKIDWTTLRACISNISYLN